MEHWEERKRKKKRQYAVAPDAFFDEESDENTGWLEGLIGRDPMNLEELAHGWMDGWSSEQQRDSKEPDPRDFAWS